MSNFYHIGGDVYRFQAWNLLGVVDGHVTIYWHRESGKWVFRKHGDYGNLVSYFPRPDNPREAAPEESAQLQPIIDRETKAAAFWDYNEPFYKWKRLVGGETRGGSNTVFEVDRVTCDEKFREMMTQQLRHDEIALSLLGIVTVPQFVTVTS